jgi:hypothetical protein
MSHYWKKNSCIRSKGKKKNHATNSHTKYTPPLRYINISRRYNQQF